MKSKLSGTIRWIFTSFSAFLLVASAAFAGPPLICHPFDIGNAKSLPWISHNWNLTGAETYATSNLANDTQAILDRSFKATLVHMETLRRATLYARNDPVAAKQLLLRLTARAEASKRSANPDALAIFDAGYLAEAYKQWLGEGGQNPARGLDGYALVKEALRLSGEDPQMEFAAALITLRGPEAARQEHAAKAIAGAKTDDLLAQNLKSHFLGESRTMSEMILRGNSTKVAAKGERQ